MILNNRRGELANALAIVLVLVALATFVYLFESTITGAAVGDVNVILGEMAENESETITATACADEITSSTNLTVGFVSCDDRGAALNISASNVKLDCNHYAIKGNSTYGIKIHGQSNITVQNCVLDGFQYGLFVNESSTSTFDANQINNSNLSGMSFQGLNHSKIINNFIHFSNGSGIEFVGNEDGEYQPNINNSIYDNTITHSSGQRSILAQDFFLGPHQSLNSGGIIFITNENTSVDNRLRGNNISHTLGDALLLHAENNTVNDTFMYNNTFSVGVHSPNNVFYGLTVVNTTIGFNLSQNTLFTDVYLREAKRHLWLPNGATAIINFTNTSHNKDKLTIGTNARVYFKSYVDVNITVVSAANGKEYHSNITVTAKNSLNQEEHNRTTVGGYARLIVTEFFRSNDINYFITPSTIDPIFGGATRNITAIDLLNITHLQVNITINDVQCGDTLRTSFKMQNSLNCSGDGLIVGADNIIIDGGTTSGNLRRNITGSGTGVGINISGFSNVTILRLYLNNFSKGISLVNANETIINDTYLLNNSVGIYAESSYRTTIRDSILGNNTNVSVYAVTSNSINITLVNTTVNINQINTSGAANVLIKWYLKIENLFNSNKNLPNTDVFGYRNSSGFLEDSGNSGAGSGLVRLELTELKKNATEIEYITPHNATSVFLFQGFNFTNSSVVNLSVQLNTFVSHHLVINCTAPTDSLNVNGTVAFCPGTYKVEGLVIDQDNTNLTCVDTELRGNFPVSLVSGIDITADNVTVQGCFLIGYKEGLDLNGADDILLRNNSFGKSDTKVNLINSHRARIFNNTFGEDPGADAGNGILITESSGLPGSNDSQIVNNVFGGNTAGMIIFGLFDSVIRNNSFIQGRFGISWTGVSPTGNNSIYHNNFTDSTNAHFIYDNSENYSDNFNFSEGDFIQGNTYSDYCDKGQSTDGDVYADAVSSDGGDWPYDATIGKIENISSHYIVDYHPRIIGCPPTNILLTESGGSALKAKETTTVAKTAKAAVVPAPASKKEEPEVIEFFEPTEAEKFLFIEKVVTEKIDEKITRVTVVLKNTGTKRMRLFPEILQEYDDPFFIVHRKTLGYKGSFAAWLAKIFYSPNVIAGRLLTAEILDTEEIILEPGEKIEKTLEIREGLILPREIKIQFTSFDQVVKEEKIELDVKMVTGVAIDLDKENNLIDVYAVIVPEEILVGESAEQSSSSTDYTLELNINKLDGRSKHAVFSDLFGPYSLERGKSFVFAQQFEYNDQTFKGDYSVETQINDINNKFEIELD